MGHRFGEFGAVGTFSGFDLNIGLQYGGGVDFRKPLHRGVLPSRPSPDRACFAVETR